MNPDPYFCTPRGLAQIRARLRVIKEHDRPQNVADIEEARAHGDLSENAEYHAAKERQSFIEGRLEEIESKVSRAVVIDPSSLRTGRTLRPGEGSHRVSKCHRRPRLY